MAAPNTLERYLADSIRTDLDDKMVFLGGPRQVGKTTLALTLLGAVGSAAPRLPELGRSAGSPVLQRGEFPAGQKLVVLDEIHKFPRWRNLVKGLFDTEGDGSRYS